MSHSDDHTNVLRIQDNIFFALMDLCDAKGCSLDRQLMGKRFVGSQNLTYVAALGQLQSTVSSCCSSPCKLGQVYWFCKLIQQELSEGKDVIICAGEDPDKLTVCALLIGCYMILHAEATPDKVNSIIRPISHLLVEYQVNSKNTSDKLTLLDFWKAIFVVKQNKWLDFESKEPDIDSTIDMEEYFHYDNPANGGMHVIVPSKLVVLRSPCDHPDPMERINPQQLWFDTKHQQRQFTPVYYADVLSDFDVKLVVSCSGSSLRYDSTIFRSVGIPIEKLHVGDASPLQLLQATDRFLTLSRLVPGAIAVHGGVDGLGSADLLICAYLLKYYGFEANSALAWVRLLHPDLPVPSLQFSAEDAWRN